MNFEKKKKNFVTKQNKTKYGFKRVFFFFLIIKNDFSSLIFD